MKSNLIALLLTSLMMTSLFSQTQKQLDERREEIRKLFGENFFKDLEDFDKRYQELMKEMFESGHGGGNLFDDQIFDQFMQKMKPHENLAEGDIKWIETDKQKILMLKFKQDKNSPLDITIENGIIQISGSITHKEENQQGNSSSFSSYTSSFSRAFNIPDDVNERSAKIENNNGEITISFNKKNPLPNTQDKSGPKSKPLLFKKDEKTI